MKRFTTQKQKTGEFGETCAQQLLEKDGYVLVEKNFNCRFGEIDLIMQKDGRLHFIEVKTLVQKNILREGSGSYMSLSSRELFIAQYRTLNNPFENISFHKKKKLMKTVEYYFFIHKKDMRNFSIDGIGIILNEYRDVVNYKVIHNIII